MPNESPYHIDPHQMSMCQQSLIHEQALCSRLAELLLHLSFYGRNFH